MIRYRVILSHIIFFMIVPAAAMDQPLSVFSQQKSIKKIIDVAEAQSIAFCGNEEILINRWGNIGAKQELTKVINVSNGQCIDLLAQTKSDVFYSLITDNLEDNNKRRALLFDCHSKKMLVYDSQTKKTYSQISPNDCCPVAFGCLPNTIMFQYNHNLAESYDYIMQPCNYYDGSIVLDEKRAEFLKKRTEFFIIKHLSTKKMLLRFRDCDVMPGLYLYDCVKDELTCLIKHYVGYADLSSDESFVVYGHGHWHPKTCETMNGEYICDHNRCYLLPLHTNLPHDNKPIEVRDEGNCFRRLRIHPNNKFFITLSRTKAEIQYWCAQTVECVATHYSPIPEKDKSINDIRDQGFISFSPDGTMLAVAFPAQCVIYNVPFKVIYGIGAKKKFTSILLLLKNYQDGLLSKEIVQLLMKKIMDVSKL